MMWTCAVHAIHSSCVCVEHRYALRTKILDQRHRLQPECNVGLQDPALALAARQGAWDLHAEDGLFAVKWLRVFLPINFLDEY